MNQEGPTTWADVAGIVAILLVVVALSPVGWIIALALVLRGCQ